MERDRLMNRRWSLLLFLAVLVGLAQFGLGQFSPWVIAAPFVALLLCDIESAWTRVAESAKDSDASGKKNQTLASSATPGGVLPQVAMVFVFHGLVIGAVMTAAGGAAHDGGGRFVMTKASPSGGCGSGGMCGGGQMAAAKSSSTGGCGSGGCGSGAAGGGCGAVGTVAGNQTLASSATGKSGCGCGGGASATSNPRAVAMGLPPSPQQQVDVMAAVRNGMLVRSATPMPPPVRVMSNQPMITAPAGRVPDVANMPLPIQGQASTSSDRPANRGTGLPIPRQPQPDLATAIQRAASLAGKQTVIAPPPPLIAAPTSPSKEIAPPSAKTEAAPAQTTKP